MVEGFRISGYLFLRVLTIYFGPKVPIYKDYFKAKVYTSWIHGPLGLFMGASTAVWRTKASTSAVRAKSCGRTSDSADPKCPYPKAPRYCYGEYFPQS